jgi:hypothetical protein
LPKPKLLEPVRNLLHWLHQCLAASRNLDHGEEMLSSIIWDSMSYFAAFSRNWSSIFAKLVHEHRGLLPSRAWHEENNRIAARARFRLLAVTVYRDGVGGFARSRAVKSCAATLAAMMLGCLPLISGNPIGQTSRAICCSERPSCLA